MKIRIIGNKEEIEEFVNKVISRYEIKYQSSLYRCRKSDVLYRVYLDIAIDRRLKNEKI